MEDNMVKIEINYEKPNMEIVNLDVSDVIRTSDLEFDPNYGGF